MERYNEKLSDVFSEIADLMGILDEDGFRVRAYRSAAQRLKEEKSVTRKTTKQELLAIPRIGPALAEKIAQYIKTGKVDFLETLRRQIPKAVRDMLQIPHLGPKRIRNLFVLLGIRDKKELIKAAKDGRIAALPGFGDKLVKDILDAMEKGQEKKRRHPRNQVTPIVRKLKTALKKIAGVSSVEAAGSYRRKAKDVGDLDMLVVGKPASAKPIRTAIAKAFPEADFIAEGETKIAFVIFPQNLQVDIRLVAPDSYGAALLYFTGSKDYNVMMRKTAIEKGYLLNEYGLFKNGEYVAGATEKEIVRALDLPELPPEKRK